MSLNLTDDELLDMTTVDLRLLLEQKRLTVEEHKELRNRRRRLQNRRYARKCASKKQSEVEKLATEVEEEVVEIQALRSQLSRTNLATKHIEHQLRRILEFKNNCFNNDSNGFQMKTIRMLHSNGQPAGLAYVDFSSSCNIMCPEDHEFFYPTTKHCDVKEIATCSKYNSLISDSNKCRSTLEERPSNVHPRQIPTVPHLSSGFSFPDTSSHVRLSCNPPCHFKNHLQMRLVRPVGGGFSSLGRSVSEY
ncbi:Basic-leucine zipper (BZIP) transcription factor, domain-containing protein isoform 1 [Schistosoma japonicum]|uniref:Basic-leucine zipper (BZIP) transcription factor, domain-containing protein isoform 1 n=1 Tax=Schistosoma japonicum TaxID=6182 RepID=C1LHG2_SCHJA|nr:Basic-leucine zipper (BZIP) transcription factor, domain-containing protein isoform 1 [Schistosoma japonicum]TNN08060.1 Basic-leucine zipper (BZIP) transcription factor, domain-containing protein isoform 1 [Schistosoma japonicum]CAX74140.1 Basic-leucine zipper (bZIP) transcription factor,domain-containing protein [Schistosoma japonicum]CAX74141.1 Basic-leucine zipper (bZIP) transcription factor,domain-containing protein [Schistosoma japonicum]